jgi:hypothetical protein
MLVTPSYCAVPVILAHALCISNPTVVRICFSFEFREPTFSIHIIQFVSKICVTVKLTQIHGLRFEVLYNC